MALPPGTPAQQSGAAPAFKREAYPAEYGNSGIMSFVINHDGKVFREDHGKEHRFGCDDDEGI